MQLKVMNYNVLHGFHKPDFFPYTPPYELNQERLSAAQKIVRAERPDILTLTEACFGEPGFKEIRMNYQELFRFPHHAHVTYGNQWGCAILSTLPIVGLEKNLEYHKPHVRAHLRLGTTRKLTLDLAHPHPEVREGEKVKYFERMMHTRPSHDYILTGDFNSLSPQDRYDRETLLAGFKEFITHNPEQLVDALLTRETLHYLLAQGVIDTYKKIHPKRVDFTIPTDFLSKDKRSGIRIDYILCSPDIHVLDAGVINTPLTNKASDHHPTFAVLEVGK